MADDKDLEQLRQMALDLVNEAMQACDPTREAELCQQALKLDPHCWPARKLLAELAEESADGSGEAQGANGMPTDDPRAGTSSEDLNAIVSEHYRRQNSQMLDDFAGLIPAQMHALLYQPFASPELLVFRPILAKEPQARIASLFMQLAEALGEKGVKATPKGNLPRALVLELAQSVMGPEAYAEVKSPFTIRGEDDYRELLITRHIARHAGLIRLYRGRWLLTAKCSKLLAGAGSRAIYPVLLHSYAANFHWASQDGWTRLDIVQQAFAFTLYLLNQFGNEWRPDSFYTDAFLQAFPAVIASVPADPHFTKEQIVRYAYTIRCLVRFAEFLGLLEIDNPRGADIAGSGREFPVRKGAMLDEAVDFRV